MADNLLITPEAILAFPNLFEPDSVEEGGEKKYSASLIFTKEAQKSDRFKAMKQALVAAAKERWGDKAPKMLKDGAIKSPFRPGSQKAQFGYPDDSVFINVRSNKQPQVVSTVKDPSTGKLLPIEDESEIYPGCVVRAHLGAFAYDNVGGKGVSFGLNGLLKVRDGERLDNYVKAEDAFDADEFATADLSDVQDGDFENTMADEGGDEGGDEDDPLADLL